MQCRVCDYKAAQKSNLKKHIESVHERIKPFKCNICEYKAGLKSDLQLHTEFVHEFVITKNPI